MHVTHWSQVLANVSVVEFVLLAVLTTLQWAQRRTRGAGWVALSFAILGGLSVVTTVDPTVVDHPDVAKSLLAVLLVMPYVLFRFVASFRPPSVAVRVLAAAVTVAIIAFTFSLSYLPVAGEPPPPHFLAYRVAFGFSCGFLFGSVVLRLFVAGRGEPPVAASRMHVLAIAVGGLEILVVVVAAFGLEGTTVTLATRALSVTIGLLFLAALVFPSFVRMFLGRREDAAFSRAVGELVSAGDSREVAERLLPHVCALVGASEAALLASDGTVIARFPAWRDGEGPEGWEHGGDRGNGLHRRITVRTTSGATHALAVTISPYLPYFGREELHKLHQLADMVGLAIERCELAEQMAFQASHDGLTGLANRSSFMERLAEALSHVGRRRSSLALLFIDLDRFKLVNDRTDHSVGDMLLGEMARRLTAMTRGVDVVARFGGDEFVAFGEVDDEEGALDMAERIRQGLGVPVSLGDERLSVTASIGVAVTTDASTTPAALLRDADNAMYEAKRFGRDQVVLYQRAARDMANLKWGLSPTRTARLNAG